MLLISELMSSWYGIQRALSTSGRPSSPNPSEETSSLVPDASAGNGPLEAPPVPFGKLVDAPGSLQLEKRGNLASRQQNDALLVAVKHGRIPRSGCGGSRRR